MRFVLAILVVWMAACAPAAECPKAPVSNRTIAAIYEREWQWLLKEQPRYASTQGDRRYDDRWEDLSPAAIERRRAHDRQVLEEIGRIPTNDLSAEDRLDLDILKDRFEVLVGGQPFDLENEPINQLDGIQQVDQITNDIPFETPKHFTDWVTRLRTFPVLVDQTIALLEGGIAKGITPPRLMMERVNAQLALQIVGDPETSRLFLPFKNGKASPAQIADGKQAIAANVIPAFRKLAAFWKDRYLPACRTSIGTLAQPNGAARYAYFIRVGTSTKMRADDIHAIGLREVARIRGELEVAKTKIGFAGSLAELYGQLKTDKKFMFGSREEMLDFYRRLGKTIDPELPKMFRKLPRTPYGVVATPESSEADAPIAYYHEAPEDGSRAAFFYVNTIHPEVRPKWEAVALALHESVPGHHLQIALATENKDVPALRRHGDYNSFVEGWGLYAETLGDEMGLYADPYSKLGKLIGEMWRAARLVIDTGIHHLGWSREQAQAFWQENVARTDMVNEIDRYIVWPGQALGYKLGELKIKELRKKKQEQLGAAFDVRVFHDQVLRNGPLPLDVLERQVMGAH